MHHSSEEPFPPRNRLADQLREQQMADLEQKLGATGRFPNGKIAPHDEGEIRFQIGSDPEKELVLFEFGKSIRSMACSPQQAIDIAQSLIQHARAVSKSPVVVQLY